MRVYLSILSSRVYWCDERMTARDTGTRLPLNENIQRHCPPLTTDPFVARPCGRLEVVHDSAVLALATESEPHLIHLVVGQCGGGAGCASVQVHVRGMRAAL